MLEQTIVDKLKMPLDPNNIAERKGGAGKMLKYLEGYYYIAKANEIFGHGCWSRGINEVKVVFEGKVKTQNGEQYEAHYVARTWLRVVMKGGEEAHYEDVGYGNGISKFCNAGEAHELAVKEAVTDSMKRCFRHFGDQFGNCLYDKDYKPDEQPQISAMTESAKPFMKSLFAVFAKEKPDLTKEKFQDAVWQQFGFWPANDLQAETVIGKLKL